jgi:hypothetical protein
MPWARVLWLPSMARPRAGTAYAYLSCSATIVELNHLPGKPGDEPSMSGIDVVPTDTRLTL